MERLSNRIQTKAKEARDKWDSLLATKMNRRQFLKGVGGIACALQISPSLLAQEFKKYSEPSPDYTDIGDRIIVTNNFDNDDIKSTTLLIGGVPESLPQISDSQQVNIKNTVTKIANSLKRSFMGISSVSVFQALFSGDGEKSYYIDSTNTALELAENKGKTVDIKTFSAGVSGYLADPEKLYKANSYTMVSPAFSDYMNPDNIGAKVFGALLHFPAINELFSQIVRINNLRNNNGLGNMQITVVLGKNDKYVDAVRVKEELQHAIDTGLLPKGTFNFIGPLENMEHSPKAEEWDNILNSESTK